MKRRNFIKGVVPFAIAGSMAPTQLFGSSAQKAVKSNKNLVILAEHLGFYEGFFTPKTADLKSSELASLLSNHHNDLTLFKNITQSTIPIGHGGAEKLLTLSAKKRPGHPLMSLDHYVADNLEQQTRHKHVSMAERFSWNSDSRRSHTMFGRSPGDIFNHLFVKKTTLQELDERGRLIENLNSCKSSNKAYLASIKALEDQLSIERGWATKALPKVKIDNWFSSFKYENVHGRIDPHPLEAYFDLIHHAIIHKRGQVFALSTPALGGSRGLIGVTSGNGYHGCGHKRPKSKFDRDELFCFESYIFKNVSKFLDHLRKSNLLDNTIVLCMGSFSNQSTHRRTMVPTLVAGGGFKHQGIVDCSNDKTNKYNVAKLFTSIARHMGVDCKGFGGFSGDFDDILGVEKV